jgi:hypothetical protein
MELSIFLLFDADTMEYVIMVRSFNKTEFCGSRIFRAPPYPEVQFRHHSEAAALADVAKIEAYFAKPVKPTKPLATDHNLGGLDDCPLLKY